MKRTIWRVITAALLLGWMTVIFLFSAQPATESGQVSGTVSYRLVSAVDRCFSMEWSVAECLKYAADIDYPVRKAAHMSEYAILGWLCYAFLRGYRAEGRRLYLLSALFAVCYAATDEFHQLFVEGRAGRVSDVCVDTAGIVIGLLVLYFLQNAYRKRCEKRCDSVQ